MYSSFNGFPSKSRNRIGSKVILSKCKSVTAYSSNVSNSFDTNYIYSDSDNFKGNLNQDGASYVYSGSYTSGDTIYVTGQSSANYNSNGYSGTLTQYVSSGTYTPADTIYVTGQSSASYNSGGYSGTLSQYVASGSYSPADSKTATATIGTAHSGHPATYSYNDGTYSGTLYFSYQNSEGGDSYINYYSGTVTKPAVDTRTYAYQGYVTKPAVDTRTYAYQGYVTKPAVDTRIYRQDYKGIVYIGGQKINYRRNLAC